MALFRTAIKPARHSAQQIAVSKAPILSFNTNVSGLSMPEVLAYIVATQSGTGTPSPSNIRPITGHTQAVVTNVGGSNLCEEVFEQGTISSAGVIDSTATALHSKNFNSCIPNTIYHGVLGTTGNLLVCWYDINKTFISRSANIANQNRTSPTNAYYFKITTDASYGTVYNNDISINYPSTDTAYHAYHGTTVTVPFGQTVYGGVLDVPTGVLTIDKVKRVIDGTNVTVTSAYQYGSNTRVQASYASGYAPKYSGQTTFGMSDTALVSYANTVQSPNLATTNSIFAHSSGIFITLHNVSFNNAQANEYLQSNPVTFVYELATPQTIQLTTAEVEQYLQNNLWATTGDVSGKYYRVD